MIETRYTIPIGIGGEIFTVTVRELNPAEKKKLELIGADNKALIEQETMKEKNIREVEIALEEAQNTFETNKELLNLVDLKEKVSLFFENKKLSKQIADLKREKLSLARPDFTQANFSLETLYKEKTNLAIEGVGKEALLKEMTQNNVSHMRLWEEVSLKIDEEIKKKLNASEDGLSK